MEFVGYVASLFGLLAFLKSVVPSEIWDVCFGFAKSHLSFLSTYLNKLHSSFYIYEYDEGFVRNDLYPCVKWHLSSLSSAHASAATLFSASDTSKIRFRLAEDEALMEMFDGVAVWWQHHVKRRQDEDDERYFSLRMRASHRQLLLGRFLNYVRAHGKELELQNREKQLYTSDFSRSIPFHHPATFDTLALDPVQKQEIVDDLREFMEGEEFYKRAGRTWKRGYLLYGPPGTGKSSMIAAISNFTGYDVYDLELTAVSNNNDLRQLLMITTNKSIIVIEDIDCSLDLSDRANKSVSQSTNSKEDIGKKELETSHVTLSGLLNFTDGLWSCCGSERIFIFTTNHIGKLDPALLRAGRMDMHILLSYCTFSAFKLLAKNYLEVLEHDLFAEVEREMEGANFTPAAVSEILIQHRKNATAALENLLAALKSAKFNTCS
ncbi:hypothetical protein O6H91_20G032300 [Diphasiastrum complanatum]|uniref:Uncharacterized protein n=1 Tax=Diphasiastrum complanatum TaxID=34168 RepID=A0ACC2APB9_DIPCM|nr:hypothetical protein O6H91_20G032300 [Diphasiastrum complanatum]